MKKSTSKQASEDFGFEDLDSIDPLTAPSILPSDDPANPKSKPKILKKKSSKSKSKSLLLICRQKRRGRYIQTTKS